MFHVITALSSLVALIISVGSAANWLYSKRLLENVNWSAQAIDRLQRDDTKNSSTKEDQLKILTRLNNRWEIQYLVRQNVTLLQYFQIIAYIVASLTVTSLGTLSLIATRSKIAAILAFAAIQAITFILTIMAGKKYNKDFLLFESIATYPDLLKAIEKKEQGNGLRKPFRGFYIHVSTLFILELSLVGLIITGTLIANNTVINSDSCYTAQDVFKCLLVLLLSCMIVIPLITACALPDETPKESANDEKENSTPK